MILLQAVTGGHDLVRSQLLGSGLLRPCQRFTSNGETTMHSRTTRFAFTILLSMVPAGVANADQPVAPKKVAEPMRLPLSKLPTDQVEAAVSAIERQHEEMINQLISEFENSSTPDRVKPYLASLLGQFGAYRACPALVAQIDFKAPMRDRSGGTGRWGQFPAAESLRKIGKPAVREILDKLPRESKTERINLMLSVVRDVEGELGGNNALQARIAAERDADRKKRLEAALKQYESLGGPQ